MRSLTWFSRRGSKGGAKSKPRPRSGVRARLRSRWVRLTIGSVIAVAAFAGSGAYLWYGGHVERGLDRTVAFINQTALDLGLGIGKVEIRGVRHAGVKIVRVAVGAQTKTPIYSFDAAAARARLLEIGWIEWATVSRRFPNTIHVDIRERRPFALWQVNKKLRLIGRDGTMITAERLARFTELPLIVGKSANTRAAEIIDQLAPYPALGKRTKALTLVGERRWNIRFENGVDVRLPENDVGAALDRLADLQIRHSILDRKLRAIDLRLPDRLIVQLLGPIEKAAKTKGKNT